MDKEKMTSMLKCVLVLASIALCSGLLLGAFNIITYVDPLQSAYESFAEDTGATFSSMKDEEKHVYDKGTIRYYAVSDDGLWHAFSVVASGGYGGKVEMSVYVKDGIIEKISVGDHGETLLTKLKNEKFFDNFIGKEIESLDALSVDGVAGATYSSNAFKNGVNAVVRYYEEYAVGGAVNE